MIKSDTDIDKKIFRIFKKAITKAGKTASASQVSEYKSLASASTEDDLTFIETIDSRRNSEDTIIPIFEQMNKELAEVLASVGARALKIDTPERPIYLKPDVDYIPTNNETDNKYYLEISPEQKKTFEQAFTIYTPSEKTSKKLAEIMNKINPPKKQMITCKICGAEFPATRFSREDPNKPIREYCNKSACRKAFSRKKKAEETIP